MNIPYLDTYINKTDNIELVLANKNIEVKKDGPYMLLKYGITADFSDAVVQQCRGIIYKKENNQWKCVCRPFDKFFNYQESNAAKIDWSSARVQEKVDGSIVKLWYDEYWHWSTNGVIDAFKSSLNDFMSFGELIRKADNYIDVNLNTLDNRYTYMFELVSPYNQVVIQYDKVHLYHLGTRNTLTGEEVDIDIGIEKPKMYKLTSLNECIRAAEAMNDGIMEQEGFVVVDKHYNRIKIKSPKYFMYHRMWNNGGVSLKNLIGIIANGNMDDAISQFPLLALDILKCNTAIAVYKYKAQKIINEARDIYEEFDRDRRAASTYINKFEYPNIGYWAIDNEGNVNEYLNSMRENNYIKVIEKEVSIL